ncbi:MAG: csm52 [Syntrophaceae bacterium]|nr:MAG: csm52 [Syntrophaceae bacterium]
MKSHNNFFLRTLAPIHVGCDEVYEPAGFVVDESAQTLISFDPINFINNLSDKDKVLFSQICARGTIDSLLELYKFMRGKPVTGLGVNLSKGFIDHYQALLGMKIGDRRLQNDMNQFTINRTAFNVNSQLPYIPGSAVKGALRTAYLNWAAKVFPSNERKGKDLEKDLLKGSFQSDPLRMLKVSDFIPVYGVKTKICYAINEKKKPSNQAARGPYQILEVIEPGAIFSGSVTIDEPFAGAGIERPLSQKLLFENAMMFFTDEKEREDRELAAVSLTGTKYDPLKDGHLLRLGRHSGAECLTIEGHRKIKIMRGRGEQAATSSIGAGTFWLAAEERKPESGSRSTLRPFGWVVLETPYDLPMDKPAVATVSMGLLEQKIKPAEEKPPVAVRTALEKWCDAIKVIKANDAGRLCSNIDNALKELAVDEDKQQFAVFVKEHMGGDFKKSKAKDKLKGYF